MLTGWRLQFKDDPTGQLMMALGRKVGGTKLRLLNGYMKNDSLSIRFSVAFGTIQPLKSHETPKFGPTLCPFHPTRSGLWISP